MSDKKNGPPTIKNRKANFDFDIEDTLEAGIALQGTEVKSVRKGKVSFADSFAFMDRGEVYLKDLHISEFDHGSYNNHEPTRIRKLLLKKSEIREIDKLISQQGYSVIPLKIYFKRGYAKVLLGLAKGKKKQDKRQSIQEKDMKRDMQRQFKNTQFKI